MAELVQRYMESIAEEIEEMQRTQLFTAGETRLILKNHKEFAYKIYGVSKRLEDFNKYITYLKVLLELVYNRRDKNKIAERKGGIEYKILRRIKNLYEMALQRFSSDFHLCLQYFNFCKQFNDINVASAAVQTMIKNCSQDPKVWQVVAAYYAHDRNDLNTALKFLNKGLTVHKHSQLLYTEAIKLELSVLKNTTNNGLEETEELQNKVAKKIETYVRFICDCIDDSKYLIEILNLLEKYTFTTKVQNFIIDRLLENHSQMEFVWHTLAQREKRGLHYSLKGECATGETCLTLCFSKYQEGLKKVLPSEKSQLWSMYLDCLIEAQHENNELPNTVKVNLLKTALEQASNEKYLAETYYIKWLELVIADEDASKVLDKGTSALPRSIDLWKLRLRYASLTEKNVEVDRIFNQGIDKLQELSLPLWFMYLRYYGLLSRDDIIDKIYQKAIEQPPEISEVLKPKYIEWLALTKGINDARKMYNILAFSKPYCKELHSTMLKLESTETDHDYDIWSRVHESACQQFGEKDVDVWINHILFYLHFNKVSNVSEKVEEICRKAEATLGPLLLSEFKDKYEKILQE